ncbi:MAG: hypothetical protein SF187_11980 [Deltaproteobacteria bacterium]|nr:hypothetical protein [Deltaproteobacteria bacterium]
MTADVGATETDGTRASGQRRHRARLGLNADDEEAFTELWHSEGPRVQDRTSGNVPESSASTADEIRHVYTAVVKHAWYVLDKKHTGAKFVDGLEEDFPQAVSFVAQKAGIREGIQLASPDPRERLTRWSSRQQIQLPYTTGFESTSPLCEVESPHVTAFWAKRKQMFAHLFLKVEGKRCRCRLIVFGDANALEARSLKA